MASVVVSSKYQVVIPKEIRERYGFAPGDRVSWYDAGDGALRLVKVLTFDEMGGMLSHLADVPFVREKDHDFGEHS